jgi:hypothetical protein
MAASRQRCTARRPAARPAEIASKAAHLGEAPAEVDRRLAHRDYAGIGVQPVEQAVRYRHARGANGLPAARAIFAGNDTISSYQFKSPAPCSRDPSTI